MTEHLDPVAFVRDALEVLPEDPTDCSLAAFPVLESTGAGLMRLVVEIGGEVARLDYLVREGVPLAQVTRERVQLERLVQREEIARHLLHNYSAGAALARGVPMPTTVDNNEKE